MFSNCKSAKGNSPYQFAIPVILAHLLNIFILILITKIVNDIIQPLFHIHLLLDLQKVNHVLFSYSFFRYCIYRHSNIFTLTLLAIQKKYLQHIPSAKTNEFCVNKANTQTINSFIFAIFHFLLNYEHIKII